MGMTTVTAGFSRAEVAATNSASVTAPLLRSGTRSFSRRGVSRRVIPTAWRRCRHSHRRTPSRSCNR
jgi:hypothetical protein